MAQDSEQNKKGNCVGAGELIQLRAAYTQYVADAQTQGEEPLNFDSWLNSMGKRRCAPMNG